MTTVDFFRDNNLSGIVELKQSQNCYRDSNDDPIIWVPLNRAVDGQTYLVLSHTSSRKLLAGEVDFKDLEVSHSSEGWGIVMPSSSVTIQTVSLF